MKTNPFFAFGLAMLLPLVLGACATTSGSTAGMSEKEIFVQQCMDKNYAKRKQSAGIGALSGAVLGGILKKDVEGAIIYGAAGAGAGYGVGHLLDKQACELQYVLNQNSALAGEIQIQKDENSGLLTVIGSNNVTFEFDSALVKPEFVATLKQIGATMSRYNTTSLVVHGYTDTTGPADYNLGLSQRRADAVKKILQPYIPNITAIGHGEDNTYPNDAQNRRVEMKFQTRQQ